ncbi:caspase family protein [Streptomyces sp. NPDC047841]|uniref:caspase family protein n=1 Tax=Streptomyces sp. NPDC047841 TaxID=3154708 RepID=UPI0034535DD0
MVRMPSPGRSRAVLIGVSNYRERELSDLPHVERNLADLEHLLTSPRSWSLPDEHCQTLFDPTSREQVMAAVEQAAAEATDTLLVYYAGHGQIDRHQERLFLTLPHSQAHKAWSGILYEDLRHAVEGTRADRRIVILDCCYAGRATVMGDDIDLAEQATVEGTCVLAASPPTKKAMFYPAERNTAFTGELLQILNHGVPDGPQLLDVRTAFEHAHRNLVQRGRPRPRLIAQNSAGGVPLAFNAQYSAPVGLLQQSEQAPMQTARGEHDDTARFAKRSGGCAMLLLVLVLFALVGTVWGIAASDPLLMYKVGRGSVVLEDQVPDWAVAYSVLPAMGIGWLGYRRLVAPYNLEVSAEGIQVRRGPEERHVARYHWHRILEAKVLWAPVWPHRRGRFLLRLRLREGTPSTLPWLSRHTWRRRNQDSICVADLGRLDTTPYEVDQALKRFAGDGVWTQTDAAQQAGYTATRLAEPRAVQGRTTRRVHVIAVSVACMAFACSPAAVVLGATSPHRYDWAFVSLGLWTLLLLTLGVLPVLLLWHRGRLTIGADGITYESKDRARHWSWEQIDRVGVMSWRRATLANGALFLRLRDGKPPARPATRLGVLLARAEDRLHGVLVCDLVSLGVSRKEIEAAVQRYAPHAWDPRPRPEHGIVQDDDHEAHYKGSFFGLGTAVAVMTGVISTAILYSHAASAFSLETAESAAGSWLQLLAVCTEFLVLMAVFRLSRTPFTVQIDDEALTLSTRTYRRAIPWEHIQQVNRLTSTTSKRAHDEFVVWLRRDVAAQYRGLWRLGAHLTGAQLRIVTLRSNTGALGVSAERLDAAMRRFAKERFAAAASPLHDRVPPA